MKSRKYFSLLTAVLCFWGTIEPLAGEVRFEPASQTLTEAPGTPVERSVRISNDDKGPLHIDFLSPGEDWQISPATLDLAPGASADLMIRGHLKEGERQASFVLLSNREDLPYLYTLQQPGAGGADGVAGEEAEAPFSPFLFFYAPGCQFCEEFYSRDLPALARKLEIPLRAEKKNIYDAGNLKLLEDLAARRGEKVQEFPVLIAGNRMFSGEQEIHRDFSAALRDGSIGSLEAAGDPGKGSLPELRWLPVFLAGLLDGINPCAFTTLIFLISYLRLAGKKGKQILFIGGSFTLAVFLTYFLVGLGAFRFIRMADSFRPVSSGLALPSPDPLRFSRFSSLLSRTSTGMPQKGRFREVFL